MSDLDDLTRLPDDFDGHVRLFPLPSMVLFPHAMQPLHIFEPRYCEMLAEAIESDQLIAMATLDASPEGLHQTSMLGGMSPMQLPPVAKTVCIGKIVSHVELDGDRHNILLVGIKRARITTEIDAGRCFRIAKIEVLEDLYSPNHASDRSQLRSDLVAAFGKVIPQTENAQKGLAELMAGSMELGPITDIISHTLPLSTRQKIELLDQSDVDRRAGRLIDFLAQGDLGVQEVSSNPDSSSGDGERDLPFPPLFSDN